MDTKTADTRTPMSARLIFPVPLGPSRSAAAVIVAVALAAAFPAKAADGSTSKRWVIADELRMRANPSPDSKPIDTLSRGTEVILKHEENGFCLIEGEGKFGHVACEYLSLERVARQRAGQDGVDPAQRWAGGSAVVLHDSPARDGAVVGRLGLNATVKLLREQAGTDYCEVQAANGTHGYAACRYLVPSPVVLMHVQGDLDADASPLANYDPERAFWIKPGWNALDQYATYLAEKHPGGPWPRNEALERMKAHLALGINGPRAEPYPDWAALKRKAAQDLDLSGEVGRLQAQGKEPAPQVWQRHGQMFRVAGELRGALGLDGPLYDGVENAERIVRVVRALEFPAIRPSYFRDEAEIAPPGASTDLVSGRFGIVYRQIFSPRPRDSGPGLYDMLSRTQVLVRPVQRIQLFKDGRLRSEPSLVRVKETLWHDVDDRGCEGWQPGFSFGEADKSMWATYGSEQAAPEPGQPTNTPPGSLYAFFTTRELPQQTAIRTETRVDMNRDDTGFIRGLHMHYDLDGDGVPDISIWEGQGKGPGHLGGPTTTDDRWYRLVLVNIGGKWKVLGADSFSYGCGC